MREYNAILIDSSQASFSLVPFVTFWLISTPPNSVSLHQRACPARSRIVGKSLSAAFSPTSCSTSLGDHRADFDQERPARLQPLGRLLESAAR